MVLALAQRLLASAPKGIGQGCDCLRWSIHAAYYYSIDLLCRFCTRTWDYGMCCGTSQLGVIILGMLLSGCANLLTDSV